jgi:hypothetical protein
MPIKDWGAALNEESFVFWRAGSALMDFIYSKLFTDPTLLAIAGEASDDS